MSPVEMVRAYYPRLWSRARVEALLASGRLTSAEAREVRNILDEKE